MALSDNLLSYYKLDESSGNASDSVGSNTLTNVGTATYSSAKINNGVDLNGSSQYLNGGNVLNLTTGAWTFSAWIKVTTTGSYEFIGGRSESGFSSDWYMRVTNTNKAEIEFRNGASADLVIGAVTVADNTWHHIVGLRNGTNVLLYVDGSADGSATDNNYNCSNSLDFHLGADSAGALNFKFNGQIDEVGIWNRALSSTEITELYNAGAGKQYPFATAMTFAISETLALTESISNLRTRLFSTSETIALTETISVLKGIAFNIAEALGLVETFTSTRTRLFTVAESLGLVEVMARIKLLWTNSTKENTTWTDQSKASTNWTNIDKSI